MIRALSVADVPAYRALMLEAYASVPDAFTSTPEERAAEPGAWWARRIADPAGLSLAFGAFDGDALVGSVALDFSSKPKTRHKALLIGMYVRPVARRQGTARRLLEAALAHLRTRPDVRVLQLTATDGNTPALDLYRSVGFIPYGLEPQAIRTAAGYAAKVYLWLDLAEGAC